jgi:hypothetical protein
MTLPIAPNTTCDIYRTGRAPPAAPDVAGVNIFLTANYERRMETGEGEAVGYRYTHVMSCDISVDVRDSISNMTVPGTAVNDVVYVPNRNGTPFSVRFVEIRNRSSPALVHKRVYLDRQQPTWPTNNL